MAGSSRLQCSHQLAYPSIQGISYRICRSALSPFPTLNQLHAMELRPLHQYEIATLRAMIDEQVDLHLQSCSPALMFVRGASYTVNWPITCLVRENIERVGWLLNDIGFVVGAVETQSIPSNIPGIWNKFFTLNVQRRTIFLPDCLWGEALVIKGVACSWSAHVERFDLANDLDSRKHALQNQYGPMGSHIA